MTRETPEFDAQRLTELLRVDALAVSPDGSWLAVAAARPCSDDAKYVHELWRVDLDDPARAPRQLTRGAFGISVPAVPRVGSR